MNRADLLKGVVALVAGCAAIAATPAAAQAAKDGAPAKLTCETGPVHRDFGGHDWVVYSCSDSASLIVMAPPGTEAGNSYIFLRGDVSGYEISAEAEGERAITDAAHAELSAMTTAEIAALLADTRAAVPPAGGDD